jgi:hypothetical protein
VSEVGGARDDEDDGGEVGGDHSARAGMAVRASGTSNPFCKPNALPPCNSLDHLTQTSRLGSLTARSNVVTSKHAKK